MRAFNEDGAADDGATVVDGGRPTADAAGRWMTKRTERGVVRMVTFSLISLLLPEREKRICGLWDHVARSTKESLIRETTTIRDHIIGKYLVYRSFGSWIL